MNNEQRGVALLIVLMLLALMAALAADMTISFHGQLHRTRQVNHHLQRQYDIELAEKLALASLTQDVKDNDCIDSLEVRKKPGGHWIIRELMGLDLVGLASL